jgi:hypothetical protein
MILDIIHHFIQLFNIYIIVLTPLNTQKQWTKTHIPY